MQPAADMADPVIAPETQNVIGWVAHIVEAIIVGAVVFLWTAIKEARKEALDKTMEVRAEFRERLELDRNAAAARELMHQKNLDDLWTAIKAVEALNRDANARFFARLDIMSDRLGQMPTREETMKDRTEMEHRIMDVLHSIRNPR